MLKAKYLKVGEFDLQIRMIPARQAFGLSKDVAQVAVQIIGALGALGAKSLDVDLATIGPELGQSIAGIESSKLDALLAGLLAKSEARVNGAWLPLLDVVDDVFAGRVMDLYLCLFEAVKLNYPDFFDRLGQQKGQGQPAQPTP